MTPKLPAVEGGGPLSFPLLPSVWPGQRTSLPPGGNPLDRKEARNGHGHVAFLHELDGVPRSPRDDSRGDAADRPHLAWDVAVTGPVGGTASGLRREESWQ